MYIKWGSEYQIRPVIFRLQFTRLLCAFYRSQNEILKLDKFACIQINFYSLDNKIETGKIISVIQGRDSLSLKLFLS